MSMTEQSIVSIDLETGGLEPGVHSVLSIGAIALDETLHLDPFYVQLEWDNYTVTKQAMAINGLDIINPPGRYADMRNRSLPAQEGLEKFANWLERVSDSKPIYAMGMNVGSFDLPMLKSVWNYNWPFHYRSIDLNSIMFMMANLSDVTYEAIKSTVTDRANEMLQMNHGDVKLHHALWDAWLNVYMWQLCKEWLQGENYGN